jgi:hypothetical protein
MRRGQPSSPGWASSAYITPSGGPFGVVFASDMNKLTARLQTATSRQAVLLRVDYDPGHGGDRR